MPPVEKRFIFHGNAVALGAHIRRKEDFFVDSVASSGLPATGGRGNAESGPQSFHQGMISFKKASTYVFGDFKNPEEGLEQTHGNYGQKALATVTITEACVSGLEVKIGRRTFHAEQVKARMENISEITGPTRFHTLTSEFSGLSIDGVPLTVSDHCDVFARCDTKQKLRDAYKEDAQFKREHERHLFTWEAPPWWCFWGKPGLPESDPILGTIVTKIDWKNQSNSLKDVTIDGNRLIIPGFGSVHLGEILVEENQRRVTLLRFQLGCPDGGECGAVDIASNGTRIPPH